MVVHITITLVEGGSILMFQTILAVSPIRKAVVADRHNHADRHNPITYVTCTCRPTTQRARPSHERPVSRRTGSCID